jgi:hypothetical protein
MTSEIYTRYDNYSIELYIGEKRSGKTLGMTAETYELIKKFPNIKVYANYKLNKNYFKNYEHINKEKLEKFYLEKKEFKHCVFLIDEIHLFLDSRKFGSKGNKTIGYALGQMGKRGNIFRGSTHFPHLVDLRLRSYCEKWNYIRKGFVFDNEFKPIKNNNKILTKEENTYLYIQIKPVIRKLVDYNFIYLNDTITYIKADKYFNMYDTEELIVVDDI